MKGMCSLQRFMMGLACSCVALSCFGCRRKKDEEKIPHEETRKKKDGVGPASIRRTPADEKADKAGPQSTTRSTTGPAGEFGSTRRERVIRRLQAYLDKLKRRLAEKQTSPEASSLRMERLEAAINKLERRLAMLLARPREEKPSGPASPPGQETVDGIKKISDTRYEVPRKLFEAVLADPSALSRSGRIVPFARNGKPAGFRLSRVRPSGFLGRVGLRNGDEITSVASVPMTGPDGVLTAYQKVRSAKEIDIRVVRKGQPVVLRYTLK